jgi:hypothetical protein
MQEILLNDFQVLPRLFQYHEKFNLTGGKSDRAASAEG